ncbi:hypothetical protein Tco_1438385 [Tanacetum coccineum]
MLKVPSVESIKISSTNVRLETTVHQKKETFQVFIDVIKNSICFKAFTITVKVPEIFIQQFWYTIKKVKDSESYEFLLANKKCIIDAEVFKKILDICPRVKGEEFTERYHIIKDDGIVSRLKFVKIEEDYQEYGLPILDMMLNDAIKQAESYQMFLKYSTGQIPPKKSIWKARKRTSSRRVVKKKVTIYVAETNIPNPDVALELVKFVSLTEAVEEEAARHVHATHAWIVTESKPGPAKKKTSSRSTKGIVIQDTLSAPKPIPATSKLKLKGVQSLTLKEQEAAYVIQALKESKKTNRKQPGTRGPNEGTGVSSGVPNESTVVPATPSEGTGTKPRVLDEEKVTSEEKVILKWGSEQESEYLKKDQSDDEEVDRIDSDKDEEKKDDIDDKSIDLEMIDYEETDDEFVHGVEQVNDEEDEEMTNAKVEVSRNGDEENTNAAKPDSGKTEEVKDDAKKAELPPTSSSLLVSSGFGDQFLKLSSDTSLTLSVLKVPVFVISEPSVLSSVQYTPSVAPVTTLPLPSVSTIPHVPHQTTAPIPTPPITTDALTITTIVPESDALPVVQLRVVKLEKDVSKLKKIDHSAKALATLKSQVLTIVEQYLGSKIGNDLQKVLQRHTADLIQNYSVKPTPKSSKIQKPTIDLEQESKKSTLEILKIKREQAKKQKMSKYTIKSTDRAALKEYDLKSALYQTMHENKSFNKNPAIHALYHALMKALIEDENAMDKGVVDTVKNHKRQQDDDDNDDDEDPSAGPNQGKKTKSKSAFAKEPVEELIAKVAMDDAVDTAVKDVVHDDDQP